MSQEKAVVSRCAARLLWFGNWFTINGTIRNLVLETGRKPSPFTRCVSDVYSILAAFVALLALFVADDLRWLVWIAIYRCTVIGVSQAAVLVNTDFYIYGLIDDRARRDNVRLLLIGILQYCELVLWFAVMYRHWEAYFAGDCGALALSNPWVALYFSALTVTTLGYGDISPAGPEGAKIVVAQLALGVFMALIVLGRFVGLVTSGASAR